MAVGVGVRVGIWDGGDGGSGGWMSGRWWCARQCWG